MKHSLILYFVTTSISHGVQSCFPRLSDTTILGANYVHPPGGGYIIFAFSAIPCPLSDVRRPMSGITHGFRSFKGKVLELLSPNLVCRLIGSVACLGLLLAVVPLLLTE